MLGKEVQLFYIGYGEEKYKELEALQDIELEDTTTSISCHALDDINTPQNLKVKGYGKNKKATMLTDFDNTHCFINFKLVKLLNLFIYQAHEYQVIIVYGDTIKFLWYFHSVSTTT